jgi:hypothetical protein
VPQERRGWRRRAPSDRPSTSTMSRTTSRPLAGSQLITHGRFWVVAEVRQCALQPASLFREESRSVGATRPRGV